MAERLTAARLMWPRSPSAVLGALAAVCNAVLRVAIVPVFVTPLFDQVLAGAAGSEIADAGALPRVLWRAGAVALAGSLALWVQDALLGRAAANAAAEARRQL